MVILRQSANIWCRVRSKGGYFRGSDSVNLIPGPHKTLKTVPRSQGLGSPSMRDLPTTPTHLDAISGTEYECIRPSAHSIRSAPCRTCGAPLERLHAVFGNLFLDLYSSALFWMPYPVPESRFLGAYVKSGHDKSLFIIKPIMPISRTRTPRPR